MNKGFTLVEFLITIFIFSLISAGVAQIFTLGNSVYSVEMSLADLQSHARNAMDRMVREIRSSSSVTVTVINTDSDLITFTTPAASDIKYYRNNNLLVREYPTGTMKNIASNVARLKFTLTGSVLRIDLRTDQTMLGRPLTYSLSQKVRLRNE